MTATWTALRIVLGLAATGQSVPPAENPVYREVLDRGVEVPGATVPLPAPTLPDGRDAVASRAVLREVAGDERAIENFTRDSVSAPFVLRTRDVKADAAMVRVADLYFIVHADLDTIDIKQVLGKSDNSTVEAGNMRFGTKVLTANDLTERQVHPLLPQPGRDEWYTHATGRLLDRIAVDATDRAVATRTPDSLTVAAATDRRFDADATFPNRWSTLARTAGAETAGSPQRYDGGMSYVKLTRLAAVPGALFVEAHFAFVEPQAWFSGAPILRSKFAPICQDQVRQLRREIQKRRAPK